MKTRIYAAPVVKGLTVTQCAVYAHCCLEKQRKQENLSESWFKYSGD